MRLGPLVLLALIALVAPSQTHAQVPAQSLETINGVGFSLALAHRPARRRSRTTSSPG